ncbi:MAG TPA: M36 family metallopeptidase [Allosphingosinicella sp.]|jgi:hypothetical protein
MTINYLPNDPLAANPALTTTAAAADRSATQTRFVVTGLPPQRVYPVGTDDFVAWQSREAAFRTLDVFESICGPLSGWIGRPARKTMNLVPIAGNDINAYYDRGSISFFQAQVGATKVYSGASSDVVAHEAGHAILDALRPDLWNANMIEIGAFHEGFGDCMAIMLALSDRETRRALLAGGASIDRANFVEATAEELSDAIRRGVGPNHNAAAPRRARNNFQWALPQTLPANGGPGTLIREEHSLGQLVSGVYYDLISLIFSAGASNEADLWRACRVATSLIVHAARQATIVPRFLESWGRTMLVVDQGRFGGANAASIKAAFARHGLAVSAAGFLAPQAPLSNAGGRRRPPRRSGARVAPAVRQRLREMLRVDPAAKLQLRELDIGAGAVVEVASSLEVDLSGLSESLRNVVANVPRPVLVGDTRGAAAVLGAVQPSMLYSIEVRDFVATLVDHGVIAFAGDEPGGAKKTRGVATGARKGAGLVAGPGAKTHRVSGGRGQPTLERISFACGCACRRHGDG